MINFMLKARQCNFAKLYNNSKNYFGVLNIVLFSARVMLLKYECGACDRVCGMIVYAALFV